MFGLVIFWQKNIGTKAACKMLARLTTGVNFANILGAYSLNKSVLQIFYLITV